jgi:hypothetical protein
MSPAPHAGKGIDERDLDVGQSSVTRVYHMAVKCGDIWGLRVQSQRGSQPQWEMRMEPIDVRTHLGTPVYIKLSVPNAQKSLEFSTPGRAARKRRGMTQTIGEQGFYRVV